MSFTNNLEQHFICLFPYLQVQSVAKIKFYKFKEVQRNFCTALIIKYAQTDIRPLYLIRIKVIFCAVLVVFFEAV